MQDGRGSPRVGSVVLAAVVVAAALSFGSRAAGERPRTPTGALPDAMCELVTDLERSNMELLAPGVYDLDADAVGAVLARRGELRREIAALATGDLGHRLDELLAFEDAVDADMLDTWDADRGELAATHSDSYGRVWSDSVESTDGPEIPMAQYAFDAKVVRERLVVGCRAPELASGPRQDTTEPPPAGRLVYYSPGQGLVVSDTAGDDERVVPDPPGWALRSKIDVVDDGDRVLVSAEQDDLFGLVEIDLQGNLRWTVSRTDVELICPQAHETGTMVLGTFNTATTDDRDLVLIDATERHPSGPLALPFASVGCADFVSGERLVVADAARRHGDARGIWTVDIDGSAPHELYRYRSPCVSAIGDVDPARRHVAVYQTCEDPLQSGVWVMDRPSGDMRQIAVGSAGPPKWSPDGSWLVFGFQPIGSDDTSTVWMAKADGTQLRKVLDETAWTPAWLPPERATEPTG